MPDRSFSLRFTVWVNSKPCTAFLSAAAGGLRFMEALRAAATSGSREMKRTLVKLFQHGQGGVGTPEDRQQARDRTSGTNT